MCVCVCVCVCVCARVKSQSQCGFYLQAYWIWLGKEPGTAIYPQCTQVSPMYGHQKSLLNNSTCVCMCVCMCVHMRVCMCARVKSQSQCRFNLQGYCIWLGKANQALLSRSICKQVNPMYGHQKTLLKNSTCVCVCMCAHA